MARPRRSPPEADAQSIQRTFAAWRNLQRGVNKDWPQTMKAVRMRTRAMTRKLR